jgi:sugar lactone lactonase YvrE
MHCDNLHHATFLWSDLAQGRSSRATPSTSKQQDFHKHKHWTLLHLHSAMWAANVHRSVNRSTAWIVASQAASFWASLPNHILQ